MQLCCALAKANTSYENNAFRIIFVETIMQKKKKKVAKPRDKNVFCFLKGHVFIYLFLKSLTDTQANIITLLKSLLF